MMMDGRTMIQIGEVVVQNDFSAECDCAGDQDQEVSTRSGHAVGEGCRREVEHAFNLRSRRAAHNAGSSGCDCRVLEEENAFHWPLMWRSQIGDDRTIH